MTRQVSKSKMNRYRVLRCLYNDSRTFSQLMVDADLSKLELLNSLIYLQRGRLVRKKKTDKSIIFFLTQRGMIKLAWLEFSFQCHKRWRPVGCYGDDNGWHATYCSEMSDLIKKLDYFGSDFIME